MTDKESSKLSTHIYTVGIRAYLETRGDWIVCEISAEGGEGPVYEFIAPKVAEAKNTLPGQRKWPNPYRQYDVSEVLEALIAADNNNLALSFLVKYGPLRTAKGGRSHAYPVHLPQFFSFRDRHIEFLEAGTVQALASSKTGGYRGMSDTVSHLFDEHSRSPLPISLVFGPHMVGLADCYNVEQAVRAAVFLDRLSDLRWTRCKQCGTLFKRKKKRGRVATMCGPRCQSRATSERHNQKTRKLKQSTRT